MLISLFEVAGPGVALNVALPTALRLHEWQYHPYNIHCSKTFSDGDSARIMAAVGVELDVEVVASMNKVKPWGLTQGLRYSYQYCANLKRSIFTHLDMTTLDLVKAYGMYGKYCETLPYTLRGDSFTHRQGLAFDVLRASLLNRRILDLDMVYRADLYPLPIVNNKEVFECEPQYISGGVVLVNGKVEVFGREGYLLDHPDVRVLTVGEAAREWHRPPVIWDEGVTPLLTVTGYTDEPDSSIHVNQHIGLTASQDIASQVFPDALFMKWEESMVDQSWYTPNLWNRLIIVTGAPDLVCGDKPNTWVVLKLTNLHNAKVGAVTLDKMKELVTTVSENNE